jgi:hypothetical protein
LSLALTVQITNLEPLKSVQHTKTYQRDSLYRLFTCWMVPCVPLSELFVVSWKTIKQLRVWMCQNVCSHIWVVSLLSRSMTEN